MPKTDRSVDLSGYATVAERLTLFYAAFPKGRIATRLVKHGDGETIFKALIFRQTDDARPAATGWAAEKHGDGEVNTFACVENTETSAVGRALANLGFTASTKRASREEMEKFERARTRTSRRPTPTAEFEEKQQAANALLDLYEILKDAEACGFPQRRSTIIRDALRSSKEKSLPVVQRLENRLRGWMARRDM